MDVTEASVIIGKLEKAVVVAGMTERFTVNFDWRLCSFNLAESEEGHHFMTFAENTSLREIERVFINALESWGYQAPERPLTGVSGGR